MLNYKPTFIYLHGFGSSPLNTEKPTLLEKFGSVITPDLNNSFDKNTFTIRQIVQSLREQNEFPVLVGTSLGGFYALYMSYVLDVPAISINPLYDVTRLKQYEEQEVEIYGTNESKVVISHLSYTHLTIAEVELKRFEVENFGNNSRAVLILSDKDEVFGDGVLRERFGKFYNNIIYTETDHRFSNKELFVELVYQALQKTSYKFDHE